MSVDKLDMSYVRQENKSFTVNLNEVIQNIHDGFILGLYIYLTSLPPMWNVNRAQLQNHFDVGRDKMMNALGWLCDNYLIEKEQIRKPDGTFTISGIVVKEGWEFIEKVVKKQKDNIDVEPRTEKPYTDKPYTANQTHINKTIINNKEKEKIKRERLSKFVPDENSQCLARSLKVDIGKELQSFKERHKGKKTQYEFRRWIELAHQFMKSSLNVKTNEIKSTVKFWEPGNPEFDRLNGIG